MSKFQNSKSSTSWVKYPVTYVTLIWPLLQGSKSKAVISISILVQIVKFTTSFDSSVPKDYWATFFSLIGTILCAQHHFESVTYVTVKKSFFYNFFKLCLKHFSCVYMVLGHVYVKYQTSGLYRTAAIAKNVRFWSQREHIPMDELNFVTPFDIQIAPLFHY